MALVSNLLLIAICITFYYGQLLRIDFHGISIPVIDVLIVFLASANLVYLYRQKKLTIANRPLFVFLVIAVITFIPAYFKFQSLSLKPIMYLIRLISIFSLSIFSHSPKITTPLAKKFFLICLFANIIFGIIQYIFWPDLTFFKSLNWDPHLNRLVSTFFDPTFTGIIYLIFLITIFLKELFPFKLPVLAITYLAIALTYSRSTFLAFFISFFYISIKKRNPKIIIFATALLITTIVCLPHPPGEGTNLERTSSIKAKIENYHEGITTYLRSPIIGHGYNFLSLVRRPIPQESSHSSSGFDSSLLTVLTTTGPIGLIFFVLGLKKLFANGSLTTKTALISILIHSLFANSLLYPWVIICLYLIA
ncbi:MAG: O-antigen ligase family protein [Candidatus Shapirobacteria bacterium]